MIDYIVEGECGEKLIKCCVRKNLLKGGKIHVCNLWEKDVNRVLPKIRKDVKIITTVMDNDVNYGLTEVNRYKENLAKLNKNFEVVQEIKQNRNFEESFIRACSNITQIDNCFKTKGYNDFKKALLKERNLERKLDEFGFDIK